MIRNKTDSALNLHHSREETNAESVFEKGATRDNTGEEDTRDESNSEAEEELFTEFMQLKGSSYHDSFQTSLKKCKERLLEKEKVDFRLQFEPTNVRDENAIVVQASLSTGEGGW